MRRSHNLILPWVVATFGAFGTEIWAQTSAPISDGPLVGAVTDQSAKIFVRVGGANPSVTVQIDFSTDATFETLASTETATVTSSTDRTAILSLTGLSENTLYYFRIVTNGARPPTTGGVGSFQTLPPATGGKWCFAVIADCAAIASNPKVVTSVYTAIANLTGDLRPQFVVQIGDLDHSDPGGSASKPNVNTLQAARNMHRDARGPNRRGSANNQIGTYFSQFVQRNFPVEHIWDDHDYGYNDADSTFAYRSQAWRAFLEYWPTHDLPRDPRIYPDGGLWRSIPFGPADVLVLDERSQHVGLQGASPTMLGSAQTDWLNSSLKATATTRWHILLSPQVFNPTAKATSAWGAYGAERNALLTTAQANGVRNLLVISGDLHSGGALDDGTNTGIGGNPGPPEVSVPHTNMQQGFDTFASNENAGSWSHTYIQGNVGNPGFVLVRIDETVIPATLTLEIRDQNGNIRQNGTGSPMQLVVTKK